MAYEDEIAELEQQLSAQGQRHYDMPASDDTLRAVIALMRATNPKDSEAERREIEWVYNRCQMGQNWDPGIDAIRKTRAAARIEGFTAGLQWVESLNKAADEIAKGQS